MCSCVPGLSVWRVICQKGTSTGGLFQRCRQVNEEALVLH